MMNDGGRNGGGVSRHGKANGFIPSSFRALSSYLRIVSSGASTVARSAVSAASSIVERDEDANHDQVRVFCFSGKFLLFLKVFGAIGERLICLANLCESLFNVEFSSFIVYF